MATCSDDLRKHTGRSPVITVLKHVLRGASNRAVQYTVTFSERTPVCCRILINNEPIFQNLFTILGVTDFERTETPGKRLLNTLRLSLGCLFLM